MSLLMHIGFDNSSRLSRRIYYFKYKDVKFKLIQTERKWQDVLITVAHDSKTKISEEKAYDAAAEFLTALSWENNSLVKFGHSGGVGVPNGYSLRKARCRCFTFPEAPFIGYTLGYNLTILPKIETEEQRIALTLFREAKSSNNVYLSFLFYWQVMEVEGGDPIGWINKVYVKERHKIYIEAHGLKILNLGEKKIGNYFYDDRRNAIAHIYRKPGKTALHLDTIEETQKAHVSKSIISEFARIFIRDRLKLNKRLTLVRTKLENGFPVYLDDDALLKYGGKNAYTSTSLSSFKKKRDYY